MTGLLWLLIYVGLFYFMMRSGGRALYCFLAVLPCSARLGSPEYASKGGSTR